MSMRSEVVNTEAAPDMAIMCDYEDGKARLQSLG
jgi:hypothetical protein